MGNPSIERELPAEVRDLAARLGATGTPTLTRLSQSGVMQDKPTDRPMRFSARQTIRLDRPEFSWRASVGRLRLISVVDALRNQQGDLGVKLLGVVPLARVRGNDAATKGEVMRYLAELAWSPDAILKNTLLSWRVIDPRTLRVSTGSGASCGEVELRLDSQGRIAYVSADDRPRKEGNEFVERPWLGRFYDYRQWSGRWIPFAAEVGWIIAGGHFIAWRGRLVDWDVE